MNNPLISIIMPVFNCEKTVSIAINSILDQTYKNIELIIVNDASTDKTREIIENISKNDRRIRIFEGESDSNRFDVKLNRNINAGYSARNLGLKQAKGDLITFQDADDASFLNRLEVQYNLLKKYNSNHVTLDWFRFDEKYLGRQIATKRYLENPTIIGPRELYAMSQRSKGFISKISKRLNCIIPFHFKRKKIINKLFFGSLENYPGAGNSPLFKREVIEKIQFRKLKDRIWPSFMGRGADKDFNFAIAETFKNSHVFYIPLYMWRVNKQNERYENVTIDFLTNEYTDHIIDTKPNG